MAIGPQAGPQAEGLPHNLGPDRADVAGGFFLFDDLDPHGVEHRLAADSMFGASAVSLVLVAQHTARADSFTALNAPGANQTVVWSINNSGQIAGYAFYGPGNQAGGLIVVNGSFTKVNYANGSNTVLHGINNSGQAVGVFNNPYQNGFIETSGALIRSSMLQEHSIQRRLALMIQGK